MTLRTVALAALAVSFAAGVAQAAEPDTKVRLRDAAGLAPMSVTAFDSLVRERISGRTAVYGDGASRWQVEYTAPDGSLYVWNPGADAALTGRWRVRTEHLRDGDGPFDQVQVCYTYADTHGEGGALRLGEEKCGDARYPLGLAGSMPSEQRTGDPFKLASAGLPRPRAWGRPGWP